MSHDIVITVGVRTVVIVATMRIDVAGVVTVIVSVTLFLVVAVNVIVAEVAAIPWVTSMALVPDVTVVCIVAVTGLDNGRLSKLEQILLAGAAYCPGSLHSAGP